jgi:hypothetical protein
MAAPGIDIAARDSGPAHKPFFAPQSAISSAGIELEWSTARSAAPARWTQKRVGKGTDYSTAPASSSRPSNIWRKLPPPDYEHGIPSLTVLSIAAAVLFLMAHLRIARQPDPSSYASPQGRYIASVSTTDPR